MKLLAQVRAGTIRPPKSAAGADLQHQHYAVGTLRGRNILGRGYWRPNVRRDASSF